jgi:hypothetical protein
MDERLRSRSRDIIIYIINLHVECVIGFACRRVAADAGNLLLAQTIDDDTAALKTRTRAINMRNKIHPFTPMRSLLHRDEISVWRRLAMLCFDTKFTL